MRELKRQSRTFVEDLPDKKAISNSIEKTVSPKNVEIAQRKRREEHGENVEITQRKRREEHGENVEINFETRKERRDKGGENVAITQRKRSEEHGENVEMIFVDPTLLVGSQRIVFRTLFNLSQKYASLDTPPLTLESLANLSELKSSQIHTATKELRKKQCISIGNRKDGRGGWVSYRISKIAFDSWQKLSIKQYRSENVEITQRKRSEEGGDKHGDSPPSSSSYLNNTTTLTSESEMPKEWASISIPSFLIEKGFRETHIKQIYQSQKNSLTFEQVQESLHEYSYDLQNDLIKPYKGAVNLFLGVVRGNGNPWASEALASAEAAAILKQKKALEIKRENEKNKDFLQTKKRVDEILSKLSVEEKKKIHPPTNDSDFGTYMYELALKEKIKTNILEKKDM
jgi:hypothetical protein